MSKRKNTTKPSSRSWDPVADWYTGWVGASGSDHHRGVAIPALLDLLRPAAGERVLDVGCGPGVLAPHVAAAGADYTGVDASPRLLAFARRHHGRHGRFLLGDATRLDQASELGATAFDAVVFLLSIQDIDPLESALEQASLCLRAGGRSVMLLTHPCFRIPRQSGWGWDEGRRLQYRRVDRYLSPLAVPMKRYGNDGRSATRSHHRPLERYVNALAACGLLVDCIRELTTHKAPPPGPRARAERLAAREIPLFLGLRAVKR